MKSPLVRAAVTLALFLGTLAFIRLRPFTETYQELRSRLRELIGVDPARYDVWILMTLVALAGALLACGWRLGKVADELGLNRPVRPALIFAILAAMPMLIGYAATGQMRLHMGLIGIVVVYPFVEELFFRGWAFRQLAVRAQWGFWPAALVTGIAFGMMHIAPSRLFALELDRNDAMTALLTGAGGVFFAWLYMSWNYNLWVPFLLHAFMNGWWEIFTAEDGAVGGLNANIFRGLALLAAVLLTVFRSRVPGLRA